MAQLVAPKNLGDSDLQKWAEFCERCFAQKTNPPDAAFFWSKVVHDPFYEKQHILALRDDSGLEILTTMRLFPRFVHWDGQVVKTAGVGEVCTDPRHRRKGLAKRLFLEQAFPSMEKVVGAQISSLHSSATGGPRLLYESMGYQGVDTVYVVKELSWFVLEEDITWIVSQEPIKPALLLRLADVYDHQSFCFNGTTFRNNPEIREKYWTHWIMNAWNSPRKSDPKLFVCFADPDRTTILAYLYTFSSSNDAQEIVVGEFASRESNSEGRQCFQALLSLLSGKSHCKVVLPKPLFDHLFKNTNVDMELRVDKGWMYKSFRDLDGAHLTMENHVIWSGDAF